MDSILGFLNQPIVITLLSLIVGSYSLALISERRAISNKRREKAVELLADAAHNINAFVPHLYSQLHTNNFKWDQKLADGLEELYTSRLKIQVGSHAYLRSATFHTQYFVLLDEIISAIWCFRNLEESGATEQVVAMIRERRERLILSWPLAIEPPAQTPSGAAEELLLYLDKIMDRTSDLITKNLSSIIK